jgi:hypothetical protein
MDLRRTSPRTKPLPNLAPDKKASGSRKRSKLTNKNAGRGQQQWKKEKQDALISLQSSSNNASSDDDLYYDVPKAEEYDDEDHIYDESSNKSRAQLLEMLQERDRKIKALNRIEACRDKTQAKREQEANLRELQVGWRESKLR